MALDIIATPPDNTPVPDVATSFPDDSFPLAVDATVPDTAFSLCAPVLDRATSLPDCVSPECNDATLPDSAVYRRL